MKIPQNILAILSDLEVDGTRVRILDQLDRATYTKVNKVLEAIGGKWSRKDKAHVFGSAVAPRLDLVMMTGEVETGQDVGWFPLAARLVDMAGVRPGERVLEPSAGEGAIVLAIQDVGGVVTAVERDRKRGDRLLEHVLKSGDFLTNVDDFMDYRLLPGARKFDRVVMNPPFCKVGKGDHLDHVHHAYAMLRPGGTLVSVMPSSIQFRRDVRYKQFRQWVEDSGTIESLPEGSFRESGTGVNTCVIRIER